VARILGIALGFAAVFGVGCNSPTLNNPDQRLLSTGSTQSGVTVDNTANAATASQVLSGTFVWDASGSSIAGTMANRGNWNMNTSTFPGAGYYSGLTSTLTTTDVCQGAQLHGSGGAAVCIADTTGTGATASQVLTGTVAWDSSGGKITGTMANNGTWNLTQSFATAGGAGRYSAVSNVPAATNICSGSTVLGVAGIASCNVLASNQHRDKATTQLSMVAESTTNAGTVYSNADPGYRVIPLINKDDEGVLGASMTAVSRTGWDNTCDSTSGVSGGTADSACTCGLSGTLPDRIADCAAHGVIGSGATWDGATKASAGQSVWKLVSRTGAVSSGKGREVWQDQRTQLLWSSLVSTSLNWCKATGHNNIGGNPAAESDGSYCNSIGNQNTSGQAVSACYEDNGTYFTQTGTDQAGKAGLNRSSTPLVGWRLPSANDFHLAEVDGIRAVMPDSTGNLQWSSTIYSADRRVAWHFEGTTGYVSYGYAAPSLRNGTMGVRCVGH
jgi:hypothetical protein